MEKNEASIISIDNHPLKDFMGTPLKIGQSCVMALDKEKLVFATIEEINVEEDYVTLVIDSETTYRSRIMHPKVSIVVVEI